ncbi:MAG: PKD domain-containing protein, partial [Phycisphaerae bacterium]
SPKMVPFDPDNPRNPGEGPTEPRQFVASAGRLDREENSENEFTAPVEPDSNIGYYDGWVEHDDLASSKYHAAGDQRLGEITSPFSPTVFTFDEVPGEINLSAAIAGQDRGRHRPDDVLSNDGRTVAAGPLAEQVHGNFGLDAGNVLVLEWMTWRTKTPWIPPDVLATPQGGNAIRKAGWAMGQAWTEDRRNVSRRFQLHPYVSPGMGIGGDIDDDGQLDGYGFRDFNLDGLIDQGEVRPAGSVNYTTDVHRGTENLGEFSGYPFNRRRLMEDCVAILDNSVDFDQFADTGPVADHFKRAGSDCPTLPNMNDCPDVPGIRDGGVSGIVLLPRGAFAGLGSPFPATDPSYYPIYTADRRDPSRNSASFTFRDRYNSAIQNDPDTQVSLFADVDYLLGVDGVDVGYGGGVGFCAGEGILRDPIQDVCKPFDHSLWFHDLIAVLDRPADLSGSSDPAPGSDADLLGGAENERFQIRYAAHRYGSLWEGFADLFSLERVDNPTLDLNPVGRWGLMADGDRFSGHPVHPVADLKVQAGWVDAVNLRTVLTPNAVQEVTFADSEVSNNATVYFYENPLNRGERFYFSRRGLGGQFGQFLPGGGLIILHTDFGNNPEARPEQQRLAPFSWNIMQADGRFDLDAGFNFGDTGDPFPGQSFTTVWNHFTFPAGAHNRWHGDGFSGIDIVNVVETPTGTRVSFRWTPIEVPALGFDEPVGAMNGNVFNINFFAFDQFAASEMRIFYDDDLETRYDNPVAINQATPFRKQNPGRLEFGSVPWDLRDSNGNPLPDGLYYFYAKLDPSPSQPPPGAEGVESPVSPVLAANNNGGDGTLTGPDTDFSGNAIADPALQRPLVNPPKVRLEGWTVTCIDTQGTTWKVVGSLSGELSARAMTDLDYTATNDDGERLVRFRIRKGAGKFVLDDQFTFVTTGLTDYSNAVNLRNGQITNSPIAIICNTCATPVSGDPPLVVDFDGRASIANGARDLSYSWSFGDGSPDASGPEVSHTFEVPGNFVVTLTVSDVDDPSSLDTADIEIRVKNGKPIADIEAVVLTADFGFPFDVQFSAAGSSDPEDLPLTYFWDFDDGRGSTSTQEVPPRHRYFEDPANPGPYTAVVTLQVTDSAGERDVASITLTPGNSPPKAQFTANPPSGVVPLEVQFDATASSDGETPNNQLVFEWNFDDPGSAGNDTTTGQTASHTFAKVGEYNVQLTVRDGNNAEATASRTVVGLDPSVAGEVPTAVIVPLSAITGTAPLVVTVDASGSSDPQNDALSYSWNFGDPNSGGLNTATTVVADHTYAVAGTFTISLTVSDGQHTGLATLVVTVTAEDEEVENQPPSASFTADPTEGDAPLTVTFDASGSSDPDGDALNFFWNFGDGSSDDGLQAVHTYSLPGTYTVTLTAVDSGNLIANTTAVIQVGARPNESPIARVATHPLAFTAPDDFNFDGNLSSDPDGDELNFTWQITRDGEIVDFGFDLVGARLLVNFRNSQAECDAISGACLAPGSYSIELTVDDGFGGTSSSGPGDFSVAGGSGGPVLDGGDNAGAPLPDEGIPLTGSANVTPTGLCGLGTVLPLMVLGLSLGAWMVGRRRH